MSDGSEREQSEIAALSQALRQFARERDWQAFHTPKNLAMALSVEAAEIVELFQWLTAEQSRNLTTAQRSALTDEIGDVFIYLTMLASHCSVDPLAAAWQKMEKNRLKYPQGANQRST